MTIAILNWPKLCLRLDRGLWIAFFSTSLVYSIYWKEHIVVSTANKYLYLMKYAIIVKSRGGFSSTRFLQPHSYFALTLFRLGSFGNHMGWGAQSPPPPFLLYLLSNYHKTWHDSTMAQNLSRAVKVKSIMTSLSDAYDIIFALLSMKNC